MEQQELNNKAMRLRSKKYREDNKESTRQYSKEYRTINSEKNKLSARKYVLKKKYKLTWSEYCDLVKEQNNKCKICNTTFKDETLKRPYVDHDHNTGKIRALLCMQCNTALGKFNDNINVLQRAIKYLKKYSK